MLASPLSKLKLLVFVLATSLHITAAIIVYTKFKDSAFDHISTT